MLNTSDQNLSDVFSKLTLRKSSREKSSKERTKKGAKSFEDKENSMEKIERKDKFNSGNGRTRRSVSENRRTPQRSRVKQSASGDRMESAVTRTKSRSKSGKRSPIRTKSRIVSTKRSSSEHKPRTRQTVKEELSVKHDEMSNNSFDTTNDSLNSELNETVLNARKHGRITRSSRRQDESESTRGSQDSDYYSPNEDTVVRLDTSVEYEDALDSSRRINVNRRTPRRDSRRTNDRDTKTNIENADTTMVTRSRFRKEPDTVADADMTIVSRQDPLSRGVEFSAEEPASTARTKRLPDTETDCFKAPEPLEPARSKILADTETDDPVAQFNRLLKNVTVRRGRKIVSEDVDSTLQRSKVSLAPGKMWKRSLLNRSSIGKSLFCLICKLFICKTSGYNSVHGLCQ